MLGTLERLGRGQISDMAITADKGFLVYAADRKIPDLTEANPRFAEMRAQLATYSARLDSGAYLQEIVDAELKRPLPQPSEAGGFAALLAAAARLRFAGRGPWDSPPNPPPK